MGSWPIFTLQCLTIVTQPNSQAIFAGQTFPFAAVLQKLHPNTNSGNGLRNDYCATVFVLSILTSNSCLPF